MPSLLSETNKQVAKNGVISDSSIDHALKRLGMLLLEIAQNDTATRQPDNDTRHLPQNKKRRVGKYEDARGCTT